MPNWDYYNQLSDDAEWDDLHADLINMLLPAEKTEDTDASSPEILSSPDMIPDNGDDDTDSFLPSQWKLLATQVRYICEQREKSRQYADDMLSGRDPIAIQLLKFVRESIIEDVEKGKCSTTIEGEYYDFSRLSERRGLRNVQQILITDGMVIGSTDGKQILSGHFDGGAYLRGILLFITQVLLENGYDLSESVHREYRRNRTRSSSASGNSGSDISVRETITPELVVRIILDSKENPYTFTLPIAWGNEETADRMSYLESTAQYDLFASGVDLSDIVL